MHDDFLWFIENYDSLKALYGNSFLAIKDKKVLGVYKSYSEGVRQTEIIFPRGTFIVQECNTQNYAYNSYVSSTDFS